MSFHIILAWGVGYKFVSRILTWGFIYNKSWNLTFCILLVMRNLTSVLNKWAMRFLAPCILLVKWYLAGIFNDWNLWFLANCIISTLDWILAWLIDCHDWMLSGSIIRSFIRRPFHFEEPLVGLGLFVALLAYGLKSLHHASPLIIDEDLNVPVARWDLVAGRLVLVLRSGY